MTARQVRAVGVLLAAAAMAGCGGGGNSSVATTTSSSSSSSSSSAAALALDTEQFLELAVQSSETSEPFAVNGGMFVFTDTSDTTEPIPINAAGP